MVEFKKDDIVEAFGVRGVVTTTENPIHEIYPIEVKFDKGLRYINFMTDGRSSEWHKIASLKLVERPKKELESKPVSPLSEVLERYEERIDALEQAVMGLVNNA